MNKNILIVWVAVASIFVALISCNQQLASNLNKQNATSTDSVTADFETDPVHAISSDDAADDPAIWVNFKNPNESMVLGTNKKAGIYLYSLQGKELFFIKTGRINNVDLRYDFDLNGKMVDIAVGSNRTDNSISIFVIDGEQKTLIPVHKRVLKSEVTEVYGICLYHKLKTNQFYVIVNGKEGELEQWKLVTTSDNKIDGEIVRKVTLNSQPEGMVADDELEFLYIGEEDKGIWKMSANPDGGNDKKLIVNSNESNPAIKYDIEGLALFYKPDGQGYLIASSQGNNSYAIFERAGENKYLINFSVKSGKVDGSEETDGLDVTHYALNEKFPAGLLVVQDGYNFDGDTKKSQNFKLVDWRKIAGILDSSKSFHPSYKLRVR